MSEDQIMPKEDSKTEYSTWIGNLSPNHYFAWCMLVDSERSEHTEAESHS